MSSERRFQIIKNMNELLSKENREGRRVALEVLEYALGEVDTYQAVKRTVSLEDDTLKVGEHRYDLSRFRNIYVLGAGKATFEAAKALEDTLQERIRDGVIIEKRGMGKKLRRIRVFEAGHPIPDEAGMQGTMEIVKLAREAAEGDLVFVTITGGCSALMPLPAEGLTLEDKRKVTGLLLECGATIDEINTVRKHMSAVKGGRLARIIHPAEFVNLIVIDEIAGKPWGPTTPDRTTFRDAIYVLKKYDLWKMVPYAVRLHLEKAETENETLKPRSFEAMGIRSRTSILAENQNVCEAAAKKAEKLGYKASILTTILEGESKDIGVALSAVAKEIETRERPVRPPCVVILGGETTVTIRGEAGEGGRNQELALSASLKIAGSGRIVLASLGTDGIDGPTDIAGAIVDGYTVNRAKAMELDLEKELRRHNSSPVFRALGDAIYTGPTGTNVMDLHVIVVTPRIHHNINEKQQLKKRSGKN